MSTIWNCPSCRRSLRVPDFGWGTQFQCPQCGLTFTPNPTGAVTNGAPLQAEVEPAAAQKGAAAPAPAESSSAAALLSAAAMQNEPAILSLARLPGWGRTLAAKATLAVYVFFALASVVAGAAHYYALTRKAQGQEVPALAVVAPVYFLASGVQVVVMFAAVVAFSVWVYGTYKNLAVLQAWGTSSSPGMAVLSYFVPILNLFRPWRLMQEIWRGSDPAGPSANVFDWQNGRRSTLINVWWAFFLAWYLSGIVAAVYVPGKSADPERVRFHKAVILLSDAFSIVAATMGTVVIHRIRKRQAGKFEQLRAAQLATEPSAGGQLT